MKKIISKLKGKKVLSFVLAAVMFVTTFSIALPMLKLDASAAEQTRDTEGNIIIDGVTQKSVVDDTSAYNTYASNYLGGAGYSTGIVIPGLDPAQDYVIQGMTYYPKRDWMLVTAYHNVADGETTQSSKVFALDASTGEFVAMFSFINVDGTTINTDHGGGIAVSENNIYYSCGDKDRKIAYAPLSALENAPLNAHTQIQLVAEKDFVEIGSISSDSKTAYSAYVCYDEGVLWMGNFYDSGADIIGITFAAADYNAPSNNQYNSMVFGYKLSGSTSAEEWANLTGAKGTDCQGNPSYAIGLNNNLKDVQYAVVDNGKLYLSRSYGSGAGNSIRFGFGESSFLTIADIDLSQPGTVDVTISTTGTGSLDKTVKAYDISDYKDYAMMPMSEGLCVIGGELFITFEGASNKYKNESDDLASIGNCDKPVDVIWQLDPYELMEVEVAEVEKSTHYEKINSLAEIEDGKEYIIVYESPEKDPVTQKNILYAFDAFGNFKDYKLSKSKASDVKGYDGMIGHAITDYDITNDGKLYLGEPDKDDVENVRWALKKNGTGENYRITNTSTYFANCNCFYFDQDQITMAPGNANYLNSMGITQLNPGNGKFYFYNGGYWLWCNAGVKADYNNNINTYYANKGGFYSGLTEQAGTFHCDALNTTSANAIGKSIPVDGGAYTEGAFYIFERAVDEVASTYESRVYTGLDSKLQADGTYTVTFETYAISPNHYQYRGVMPTDYIIVADTSTSIGNSKDGTGILEFNGNLGVASLSVEANTADDNGVGVNGYGFSNPEEDIYIKHTDGKYYKVYLAVKTAEKGFLRMRQQYWAYFIADDGLYYVLNGENDSTVDAGITETQFKNNVDNSSEFSDYSTKISNGDRRKQVVYTGPHYRFDNVSHHPVEQEVPRINSLKEATKDLIGDIAAENSQNRIALLQYGADANTGYYNTSGALATSGYTDAFWNVSNAETLKGKVDAFTATQQTSNEGIEFNNVNEIIANSGATYKGADSNRNVVIILLTDGVVGADGGSDPTAAANKVIPKALAAKKAGAFIYTVMIGADGSTFDRNTYVEAVSSKYAEAESMTKRGGQSVDGINYNLSLATATINNYINFGEFALKETSMNNGVGLENLDVNSYLRGELTNVFMSFNEDNVKVELVPGVFDSIGRFTFDEDNAIEQSNVDDENDNDVDWDVDTTNRTITVTKYDYASQYIAKNRKDSDGNDLSGNKLRITISGLLLDPEADISNRMVTNTDTTGIYKEDNTEFKGSPTAYVNVNDYTYVLDYGLDLLDVDVNGTMLALDEGPNAQPKDTEGKIAYRETTPGNLIDITDDDQNLIYKMTPKSTGDTGYILIKRPDGTYDWFKINVVPASNIYFEETSFDVTGSSNPDWTEETAGTSLTNRDVPEDGDVVGFDNAYDNNNKYSNGTIRSTTVSSSQKRSDTASVTFKGNGFDLVSACGPNTGVQLVAIKQGGKTIKSYIVDTYYDGELVSESNPLVSQVPIVNWRTNTFGEYTVETKGYYLKNAGALPKSNIVNTLVDIGLVKKSADLEASVDVEEILAKEGMDSENVEVIWFDDNSILNGGTGAKALNKTTRSGSSTDDTLKTYIDGFRIYNPLGTDSSKYAESEKNASYVNVIENLAPVGADNTLNGIGFISGTLENGVNLSFSNYESVGPQGEFYLKANQAVTFKVKVNPGDKVMLGLRAVNGATTINVNNVKNVAINSATEMFYDISNCIGDITVDNTEVQVTIQNGSGILALNQVKFSGGAKINAGNTPAARSLARTASATAPVSEDIFLPLTQEDLIVVEKTFTTPKAVDGIVENGVIIPVEEEIPEDNTNTGDDNTNTDNDNTNTDNDNTNNGTDTEGSTEEFSILSLIQMIIKLIEKILKSAFGAGSIA